MSNMKKNDQDTNELFQKSKPSSHREFFERIYGHLENTVPHEEITKRTHHIGNINERDAENNSNSTKIIKKLSGKKNPIIATIINKRLNEDEEQNISTDYSCNNSTENESREIKEKNFQEKLPLPASYNLQFCQQTLQVSMRPFYSVIPTDPLSIGFSAFLARKRRKEGKIRRQRTTFSNEQTLHLENEFRVNEYISRNRRYELAEYLRLTETQIKIWFQNRRAKDKRIEKAQLDQQYRNLILSQRYFSPPIPYPNLRAPSTTSFTDAY